MSESQNLTPEQIEKQERIVLAYTLHCQGYSYDRIGYELGCAKSTAWSWVKEAQQEMLLAQQQNLNILRNDAIATINDLMKRRYEDFKEACDLISEEGRLYRDGVRARGAIVQDILKLVQERNKLLGLYAPERVEQFIVESTDHDEEKIDYSALSLEELSQMYADSILSR
jgi:transposase-like protein